VLYSLWLYIYNSYISILSILVNLSTKLTLNQFSIINIYSFLISQIGKISSIRTSLVVIPSTSAPINQYKITQWFVLGRDVLINFHQTYFNYQLNQIIIRFFGVGLFYIYYSTFIMYIDACLTDDEPIWEPIEWSLVQTWILFLFVFAWIAENLIVSRYGSYTGRDKRVWFAWYKTFWLMELYYIINFGAAIILVIVPFYYELNYNLSFVVSWWHWYTRLFFFKFISVYSIILMYAIILQFSVRWLFWKKSLVHIIIINIFIGYLLYTHFIMAFFGYFTNPTWYQQSRPIDYIQLSHEPSRWGWGTAKKDHFTYHNVKTVFWFKNDGPYASAFLLSHLYVFLSLFFLYIYWSHISSIYGYRVKAQRRTTWNGTWKLWKNMQFFLEEQDGKSIGCFFCFISLLQ
jgi:hypothetical protein